MKNIIETASVDGYFYAPVVAPAPATESTITAAPDATPPAAADPDKTDASAPVAAQLVIAKPAKLELAATSQTTPVIEILKGRVKVADLKPHPANAGIYGENESVEDLVESMARNETDMLESILVTKSGQIVSGHRRHRAAKLAGKHNVAVRLFESDDETVILNAFLESNQQRVKSNFQLAKEATLRMQIKKAYSKRRQAGEVENLPPAERGKTRDAVGKELGISGRSVAKAIKITGAVAKLRGAGRDKDADEVEAATNKGFDAGLKHAAAKGAVDQPKVKTPAVATDLEVAKLLPAPAVTAVNPVEKKASEPSGWVEIESVPANNLALQSIANDRAVEHADAVITYLRESGLNRLTPEQKRTWKKILQEIQGLAAALTV